MTRSPRKARALDPPPALQKPALTSRFESLERPLGIAVVWVVIVASTLLNAWGWLQSTAGLIAGVVVALVIAAEILGATLLQQIMRSMEAKNIVRSALATALFVGCVAFNAYSGHRAVEMIELARVAPEHAKTEADALIAERQRRLDAVPPVRLTDDQGRPIGPQRLAILQQQREADLERLTAELSAAQKERGAIETTIASSVPAMDGRHMWGLVILLELIKAAALFALARPVQRSAKPRREAQLEPIAPPVEPLRAAPAAAEPPRAAASVARLYAPVLPAPPAVATGLAATETLPRRYISAGARLELMRQERLAAQAAPQAATTDLAAVRPRGRAKRGAADKGIVQPDQSGGQV